MGTELTNSTSWRMRGASASLACVVDSEVTSQKTREREKEVYEEEYEEEGEKGGGWETMEKRGGGEKRRWSETYKTCLIIEQCD